MRLTASVRTHNQIVYFLYRAALLVRIFSIQSQASPCQGCRSVLLLVLVRLTPWLKASLSADGELSHSGRCN